MSQLEVPFTVRGVDGLVDVELESNDDPAALGYGLLAPGATAETLTGYPVCTARIEYPARGYAAMFGWIQFVQSSDSEGDPSIFELDPIYLYREVSTPFAWFGLRPTLFDAPTRETRSPMRWRARSYLCVVPDAVISREVAPVCGFAWGFDADPDSITIVEATTLNCESWNDQLMTLRTQFPGWSFRERPLDP